MPSAAPRSSPTSPISYVARGPAVLLAVSQGLSPAIFRDGVAEGAGPAKTGWGLALPGVYAVWLVILWPMATWFADIKVRRRWWWLSYV